jgi:ATP phosphoribosyltransferase regulatory subunit
MRTWLLPEYIEDILPGEARRIEQVRRRILDDFATHGYELVMPPLLEYVDSLLTGTGHDLDLQTFKLVDQLSGRMLGVRADITPQVARIDAHLLNRDGITRLCYAGSVLRTLPDGMNRTREPLQIGAEIYGHRGIESDVEVQRLMLRALQLAGVREVSLDIGHVAVFRALLRRAKVSRGLEADLFQAMQAKDAPGIGAPAGSQYALGACGFAGTVWRAGGTGTRTQGAAGIAGDPCGAARPVGAVEAAGRSGAHPQL